MQVSQPTNQEPRTKKQACRRYDVGKDVGHENVDEVGEAAKAKATLTSIKQQATSINKL